MITKIPRAVDSDRTPDGLPKGLEPESEWPCNWTQINGGPGTQPLTAKVDNRNSGNVNHHMPYMVGLAFVAGAALFGVLVILWKGEAYMEAVAKGESAKAMVLAERAMKEASTAKDVVDVERSKVKAYEQLRQELKNERR